MWKEFKKFIANESIVTMATGIIMGAAFTSIVTSLVEDIFMPIIVALTGQADVSALTISIGNTTLGIGSFIQAIINFVLIAALLYVTLKALGKAQGKNLVGGDEPAPAGPTETELLQEILTELKRK
ncbi:large conductance mechanosensitive channel protein MscL [Fundicoccus culcitae]|uniref:Large-conductance mechanosensitive channel n=1 Tax=Fundicoccus culcitae TaxID=2969821 RepID=A0ABY5P352_9LACT|nr:large conductance mechanosensitive channel protein MscL [Fundicoccus culcitae]UUX33159.1 large conductance mechanosensitive channel protein MscL [Fundicoccus culcitae]